MRIPQSLINRFHDDVLADTWLMSVESETRCAYWAAVFAF